MSSIRVRFAPSPTGFFHVGSARTALFNWLYAKHTKGKFILRIEDTDHERNTPQALHVLLKGMRWLGLDWDEGPEKRGEFGPYFQSQRNSIYQEYLQKLRDSGRAYDKDGAVYFKLLGERYTAYDSFKKCTVEKVKTSPQVINDLIRGRVERQEEQDFVIFRKNGEPVFHFVNVVDDITMNITHVIRGEDHLSNTSKHAALFNAFGAPLPVFAHIPLILKSSGSGKMSKRDQGALLEEYEQRYFLPEAVQNYLCLLGWSPKEDREVLPIKEIISLFDLPDVSKNNARFDEKKLSFINMEYIRALPLESFCDKAQIVLEKAKTINSMVCRDYLKKVMAIIQEKTSSFETLPAFCHYFFNDLYNFDEKAGKKILKKENAWQHLSEIIERLEQTDDFSETELENIIQQLAKKYQVSTGNYIHPTRYALTGLSVGPSFYGILNLLGKEKVLYRLKQFLLTQKPQISSSD